MANIGGYRGWHLCAEVTKVTTNSISVNAWIHADSGYSCGWGARTMTASCNGSSQSATINKMNNSGNASSNVVSFTFSNLNAGTYYTVSFSYDIRATLSGSYQKVWEGSIGATTEVLKLWNDINAFKPDGSTQNGLIFDLSTSDGGRWTNLTNEPASFTKPYGTTATISNIRPNVTGAHYTSNNVTGNAASSFTWTFTTADWACALYSAWNTYTVTYNGNGATGGSTANSSHTYNTAKALTANGYTRTGYKFAGWSTSNTATSATYSDGQSVSNLTATNGGTVTLYAVWTPIAPYSLSLSGTGNTTSSISLKLVASSAVAISNYTVYYKTGSATTYSSKSFGSSATGSITGLISDANYTIYFTATNAAGTTQSGTITYSTKLTNPTVSTPVVSDLLPFSCTITANGSISPARTLIYEFSNDNGNTWRKYNLFDWGASSITALGTTISTANITGGKKITINSVTNTSGQAGFYISFNKAVWDAMATGDKYVISFTLKSSSSNTFSQNFGTHWEASSSTIIVPTGDHTYTPAKDKYMICTCNKSANWRAITFYTPYNNIKAGDTFEITNFMITKSSEKLPYADYYSNTYYWSGLQEETLYPMKVKVTAKHTSQNATDTTAVSAVLNVTTPADQAKIRIKKDGSWVKGKTYLKKNGQWVKAKKIYIKVNGEWKINNNYDS